jgi:hypothetical protein
MQTDKQQLGKQAFTLMKKYANIYIRRMHEKGIQPDPEELLGELGVAAAKAINYWTPEAQQKTKLKASFVTYLVCCFDSAVYDYMQALERQVKPWNAPQLGMGPEDHENLARQEQEVVNGVFLSEFLAKHSGLQHIIIREKLNPSPQVVEAIKRQDRSNRSKGRSMVNRNGDGDLVAAIAKVYNFRPNTVWYQLRKLKQKYLKN